jgi:hypothetical protein
MRNLTLPLLLLAGAAACRTPPLDPPDLASRDSAMPDLARVDLAGRDLAGFDLAQVDQAGALADLSWVLPCTVDVDSVSCADINPAPTSATLSGATGLAYDVTLRFSGVVEQKSYLGGSNDGAFWQVGGTPASDGFNWYRLDVSSPAQTYYVNRGVSSINRCFVIDYTKTLRVDAGATVTAVVNDIGGHEIKNVDGNGKPLVAPVAPAGVTQPFNGQFVTIQVISVLPAP